MNIEMKFFLKKKNKIWVGVVMPCYDKKVESSRKEFESKNKIFI